MHCFNHPTYEAAGVCRNCGRALCHDCIAICEEAVACKGKCEARVEAIQQMITTNQVTTRALPSQMRQNGIYAITCGVLFALMGSAFFAFIGADFGRFLGAIFILLGIMIMLRGVAALRISRKYAGNKNATPRPTTFTVEGVK
jgi:hypothetical protein